MHEFEGLLFSDTTRFGHGIGRPDLSPKFQAVPRQLTCTHFVSLIYRDDLPC